ADTNTGTGSINSPDITDPNGMYVGMDFEIAFSGTPAQYSISVFDKDGTLVDGPTAPATLDGTGRVMMPGGLAVSIHGEPNDGDVFRATSVAGEDINVFDTLEKMAQALRSPIDGDTAAQA